jgi:hypothetical protein
VTPIYKSEDKTLCENYRPISVISSIAKIFEKLVCRQLNTFLDNNNIIVKNQSFPSQSLNRNLVLQSTEMWLKSMDQGQINGVIFLDLKKHLIRLITRFFCQNYKLMGYATTRSNGSNRIWIKESKFAC